MDLLSVNHFYITDGGPLSCNFERMYGATSTKELSERIESIPIEDICRSIFTDRQIIGEDHVTTWSDGHRYVVVGWQVGKSGIPLFYWTGADVPEDVAECRGNLSSVRTGALCDSLKE